MQLILEQEVVHRPEFMLRAGCFRRLRGELRMRVHLDLRKMAVHKAQLVTKMLEHHFHRRVRLAAGRAEPGGVGDVGVAARADTGRILIL